MIKCVVCGVEIKPPKKKYCSNNCKAKGHWHNTKEQSNTYHSQTIRALDRKMKLIEIMGGCSKCNYNKNISALEFHHKDPNEKESQLGSRILSNRTWEYILKEAGKCILLCANCHREEHHPEMFIENVNETLKIHKRK